MSDRPLPRHNPFRTARTGAIRYRLDVSGWDALQMRFEELGGRGALVGRQGAGKSTLWRELLARFESDGRSVRSITVRGDQPPPPRAEWERFLAGRGPETVLGIDGAGHLPWWTWRRILRQAGPARLVVTLHKPGRLPTLRHCQTDLPLLQSLIGELLGTAPPRFPEGRLENLLDTHAGNLRDVFWALYDDWQEGRFPGCARSGIGV